MTVNSEESQSNPEIHIIESEKSNLLSTLYDEDLFEKLKKIVYNNVQRDSLPISRSRILILQRDLSKHIFNANADKIIEILIELLNQDINIEILSKTKLIKLLNYFIKSYSKCDSPSLKALAKLIKIIYFKWKNLIISNNLQDVNIITEKVRDPRLKEQVCKKVISILSSNGFESKESESLAISIELNIRKRDPTMKDQYIRFIRKMLKDIQSLDRTSYLRIGETL